ncbi:Histidine phosphatase superfamily [compost metagenome]
MRIGLVRHFKVEHPPLRGWVTGEQFTHWVKKYDEAAVQPANVSRQGHSWDCCICSDLPRAVHTASRIYSGAVTYNPQLREIGVAAAWGSLRGFRLPAVCWMVLGRLLWLVGHASQPESRQETRLRIKAVLDEIETGPPNTNVLLVTHGALMKLLERELRRRAYYGQRMNHPRNGKLYIYEK